MKHKAVLVVNGIIFVACVRRKHMQDINFLLYGRFLHPWSKYIHIVLLIFDIFIFEFLHVHIIKIKIFNTSWLFCTDQREETIRDLSFLAKILIWTVSNTAIQEMYVSFRVSKYVCCLILRYSLTNDFTFWATLVH